MQFPFSEFIKSFLRHHLAAGQPTQQNEVPMKRLISLVSRLSLSLPPANQNVPLYKLYEHPCCRIPQVLEMEILATALERRQNGNLLSGDWSSQFCWSHNKLWCWSIAYTPCAKPVRLGRKQLYWTGTARHYTCGSDRTYVLNCYHYVSAKSWLFHDPFSPNSNIKVTEVPKNHSESLKYYSEPDAVHVPCFKSLHCCVWRDCARFLMLWCTTSS